MGGKSGKGKSGKTLGYVFYVFIVLGAVGFGFGCFLGRDFYTLGDKAQSIAWAAAAAAILLTLAVTVAQLKRTAGNFMTCFVMEMISLILFLVAAGYFAYSDLSHYFVVTKQKDKIQSKLDECITHTEKMFSEYDAYVKRREEFYGRYLEGLAGQDAKKTRWSEYARVYDTSGSVSDAKQREEEVFKLHANLFPSNYDKMKQISSNWLADARNVVKNGSPIDVVKPIGIVDVVNSVDTNSTKWRDTLIALSKYRHKMEDAEDFAGRLSFGNTLNDVKARFRERGGLKSRLNWMAIVTTLVLVALMLLYYINPGGGGPWGYSSKNTLIRRIKDWLFGKSTSSIGKDVAIEDDTTIPKWF